MAYDMQYSVYYGIYMSRSTPVVVLTVTSSEFHRQLIWRRPSVKAFCNRGSLQDVETPESVEEIGIIKASATG